MLPMERLAAIADRQPYPLLFATVSGAHLYGFPSVDSDCDLRGVHILPLREVIGLVRGEATIEVSQPDAQQNANLDLDLVTHDIEKFLGLLLKRNGYVLEQLYSPLVVFSTPEHDRLKAIARGCITRYHSHHYLGFARTQWRLFAKNSPYPVKPLLYVYRVLLTGIHLMQTGEVEANLVKLNEKFQLSYLPELIDRKVSGRERSFLEESTIAFHQKEYDRLCQALKEASETSCLLQEPSAKAELHDFLIELRLKG